MTSWLSTKPPWTNRFTPSSPAPLAHRGRCIRGPIPPCRVQARSRGRMGADGSPAAPSAPTQDTVEAVNAEPIALKMPSSASYTNSVNLLDCAAHCRAVGSRRWLAVRASGWLRAHFTDRVLAADRRYVSIEANRCGMGAAREAAPIAQGTVSQPPSHLIGLRSFVVGAHLLGHAAEPQLIEAGCSFCEPRAPAADYRLYVLPDIAPAKPGSYAHSSHRGPGIPR